MGILSRYLGIYLTPKVDGEIECIQLNMIYHLSTSCEFEYYPKNFTVHEIPGQNLL